MENRRNLSAVLTLFFLSFLAGFLLGPPRDSDLKPNFRCYGQAPSQCQ
jgi:hypothetical protein